MTHSRTSSKPTETIWDFKVHWYNFMNVRSERKLQSLLEKKSGLSMKLWWSQDNHCKLIKKRKKSLLDMTEQRHCTLIFPAVQKALKATPPNTHSLMSYLAGRTGPPEGRSFPWYCSEDKGPSHHASGLLKTGVEIRPSQSVQGTRKEASEDCACTLEKRQGTLSNTLSFYTHI